MTYTVHKEVLSLGTSVIDLYMPELSEILTAREQGENISIWYRCNPTLPLKRRRFIIVPTGGVAPHPENSTFIGLASMAGGLYIFHVFELLDI